MKYLYILLSVLLLFSCKSEQRKKVDYINENSTQVKKQNFSIDDIDSFFVETNVFPYKVDSIFNSNVIENFQPIDFGYLKILYQNVKNIDNNTDKEVIKSFIAIDSLRDSGLSDEDILSDYPDFYITRLVALHKFKISDEITAYSWFISFSDFNQGPEYVYITLSKNGELYSCFKFSVFSSYSDSPMWTLFYTKSEILSDGLVKINAYSKDGEYNDLGESETLSSSEIIEEFSVITGDISNYKKRTIENFSENNISMYFIEKDEFPFYINESFADYNFNDEIELDFSCLNLLYKQPESIDTNNFESIIDRFIRIDSLKDAGIRDDEKPQDSEFKPLSLYALARITISEEIEAYIWCISFSEYGISEQRDVFITLFKNEVPYSCFKFAEFYVFSDTPVWADQISKSQINKDGKVIIHNFFSTGEHDFENNTEVVYNKETMKEFSIITGNIKNLKLTIKESKE